MKDNLTENDYRTLVILKIWPWLVVVIIVLIVVLKDLFGDKIDPMDNSVNKSRKIIEHLNVVDSTNNGFRVVFASKDEITEARLKEIKSRESLKKTFQKLKMEGPVYFDNNLLETNIYAFARFSLQYKLEPEIEIHNIFIYGQEKCNMYIGPNPKIKNSATRYNFNTEQGCQYLSKDDIYNRTNDSIKIYRYWKCSGINQISYTDEKFSHFSEDERIW